MRILVLPGSHLHPTALSSLLVYGHPHPRGRTRARLSDNNLTAASTYRNTSGLITDESYRRPGANFDPDRASRSASLYPWIFPYVRAHVYMYVWLVGRYVRVRPEDRRRCHGEPQKLKLRPRRTRLDCRPRSVNNFPRVKQRPVISSRFFELNNAETHRIIIIRDVQRPGDGGRNAAFYFPSKSRSSAVSFQGLISL